MAGDPLDPVSSGQKLRIPAAAYNAWCAAARAFNASRLPGGAGSPSRRKDYATALVRNATGEDAAQFTILAIGGVVIDPMCGQDAEDDFRDAPIFDGYQPAGTPEEPLVILLEPVKAGDFGQGVLSGTTPVKINVLDTAHPCAVASKDDVTALQSAPAGPVRILWKAGTGDDQWAVVCLNQAVAAADEWTVFVRRNEEALEWAVFDSALDAATAGRFVSATGNTMDVPASAWTPFTERSVIYARFPVNLEYDSGYGGINAPAIEILTPETAGDVLPAYEEETEGEPPEYMRFNIELGIVDVDDDGNPTVTQTWKRGTIQEACDLRTVVC